MSFSGMSSCDLQQYGDVDRITSGHLAEVLDNTLVQALYRQSLYQAAAFLCCDVHQHSVLCFFARVGRSPRF